MKKSYKKDLENYIKSGITLNNFLTAVICNDLIATIGFSDYTDRAALQEIVIYIRSKVPDAARGNMLKMNRWIAQKGLGHEMPFKDFESLL